jgi:hypothetical protein
VFRYRLWLCILMCLFRVDYIYCRKHVADSVSELIIIKLSIAANTVLSRKITYEFKNLIFFLNLKKNFKDKNFIK